MRILFNNFDIDISMKETLTYNPDIVQKVIMMMGIADENITRKINSQTNQTLEDILNNLNQQNDGNDFPPFANGFGG